MVCSVLVRRTVVPLLVFCLFALGCDSGENLILLRLRSDLPVQTISVQVTSLDGLGPPERLMDQRITDPSDIRVAIRLEGSALVSVHVTGNTASGETVVATRCYAVEGTVEDEAILAGPINGMDLDMDTFVPDASQVCLEPDGEGGSRPCNDGDLHLCDNSRAQDCNDDPDAGGANIYPGAPVVCRNDIDEDCDGMDEQCADNDGDGSNACAPGETERCDCDDENPMINPGVDEGIEFCNDGIDQNCDGFDTCCNEDEDSATNCRVCSDAPGVPMDRIDQRCINDVSCSPIDPMTGMVDVAMGSCVTGRPASGDCDDTNPAIFPGADETCDGEDNNCNGLVDEPAECLNPDQDNDMVLACGAMGAMPGSCEPPEWDCDAGFAPTNREQCDGFDNDIDMMIDEDCPAGDGDGDGQVPPVDCDDSDRFAYDRNAGPGGAELPDIDIPDDGRPQNCQPGGDRSMAEDLDGDGYVEVNPSSCENNPAANPDATEVCNAIDDDCDLVTDELLDVMQLTGCVRPAADPTRAIFIDFFGTTDLSAPMDEQLALFQNCGACRNVCDGAVSDVCTNGVCNCSSETGSEASCLDVLTAELGRAPTNPICSAACGGCADLDSDAQNCGGCGRTCGAGEVCMGGVCTCGADTGPMAGMDMGDPEACQTGDLECCNNSCVNVTNDRLNCGACDYECGANSDCANRSCRCDPTRPQFEDCDGDVDESVAMGGTGCEVDLSVPNNQHCGTCGNNCGSFATCNGALVCSCNASRLDCTVGRPWCETGFSTNNCGACSNRCGAGETCNGGGDCACGGTTAGSGPACTGNDECCSGTCRDLTQTANCRSCGNTCRTNETCGASNCRCDGGARCTGSDSCCPGDGGCVNTDTNRNNCGGCGNGCSVAQGNCAGGNCRCNGGAACGGGMNDTCCGGAGCRNLGNDVNHCGACARSCGASETCSGGQCQCAGESGGSTGERCTGATDTCCPGDGCVNTNNDVNNCGGCGITCGPSETCSAGRCVCSGEAGSSMGPRCTGGDVCCPGNGCRDLSDDAGHCGMCGQACGASETCSGGMCQCAGEGGGSTGPRCTGATNTCCPGSGCVNTSNDTGNCGACGATCGAGETCGSGQCRCGPQAGGSGAGELCVGGTPDCCPSVGCVNRSNNNSHCGACDTSCGTGETCGGGACGCGPSTGGVGGGAVCTGGTPDCCAAGDGCVNLTNDGNNCGACGTDCATGASCSSSTCRCNGGGDVCFDGVEGNDCMGTNCRCFGSAACTSPDMCSAAMMMCQ